MISFCEYCKYQDEKWTAICVNCKNNSQFEFERKEKETFIQKLKRFFKWN